MVSIIPFHLLKPVTYGPVVSVVGPPTGRCYPSLGGSFNQFCKLVRPVVGPPWPSQVLQLLASVLASAELYASLSRTGQG